MAGLYVHIPFCVKKCPYCNFYSVRFSEDKAYRYCEAAKTAIEHYNELYDTVYFGGGTPTLLIWEIGQIMAKIRFRDKSEVSIEANPSSLSVQGLTSLRTMGFNRISIGVQSFSDVELASLGRRHTSNAAVNAIRLAYDAGFDNISVDIMIGTPFETPESIRHTVEMLKILPIKHVSVYILKVEKGTIFYKRNIQLPDEENVRKSYLLMVEELEKIGFMQYEISNFAKKGYECRHNLKYWKSEEYIGIGPAAHSFYDGERFSTLSDIDAFTESPLENIIIEDENAGGFEEYAMLKLRLKKGLEYHECERYGIDVDKIIERCKKIPSDLINITDKGINLTPQGFIISNAVISRIIFK